MPPRMQRIEHEDPHRFYIVSNIKERKRLWLVIQTRIRDKVYMISSQTAVPHILSLSTILDLTANRCMMIIGNSSWCRMHLMTHNNSPMMKVVLQKHYILQWYLSYFHLPEVPPITWWLMIMSQQLLALLCRWNIIYQYHILWEQFHAWILQIQDIDIQFHHITRAVQKADQKLW